MLTDHLEEVLDEIFIHIGASIELANFVEKLFEQ